MSRGTNRWSSSRISSSGDALMTPLELLLEDAVRGLVLVCELLLLFACRRILLGLGMMEAARLSRTVGARSSTLTVTVTLLVGRSRTQRTSYQSLFWAIIGFVTPGNRVGVYV